MSFRQPIKTDQRFADSAGEVVVDLFDYDVNSNLIYRGVSSAEQADENEAIWHIAKYTYSGVDLIRTEFRSNVAWSQRALLNWIV